MRETVTDEPYIDVLSDSVNVCHHDEGMMLVDMANGQLFATNATGAQIWRRLHVGQGREMIARELSREGHVSYADALEHVLSFVSRLREARLLKRTVSA
jgi:hypothetical protein